MAVRRAALVLGIALLLALAPVAQAQKALTNNDVLEMVKAGFSEDTVLTAVRASDPDFDTSVQGLIALKNAGVSENIISAMLAAMKGKADKKEADARSAADRAEQLKLEEARTAAARAEAEKAAEAKNPEVPDDVGVYAIVKGKLMEVNPEVFSWRTGGVGKSILTMGMTKGHINGAVHSPHSKTRLALPIEIVIRCAEGISASEYQLVKMDEKDDRREFRALTGGVYHASAGTEKNAVPFDFKKIAPRTYKVVLPNLPKGEYGFLPLTTTNVGGIGGGANGPVQGGTMNPGKVYTFAILE